MKFTPTWYKSDVADIPSFQELEDITGMAYNDEGIYTGPKEKPEMQLVMDQRTNRQYWAPKEYDEDAIKYGAAKLEQDFNSKEWWGMVHDPHLTMGQKVSTAYIEGLKQAGKFLAKAPTEIVAGVTGITDAFGVDAGALTKAAFANNPMIAPAYFASNVARKGVKATAEDYLQLFKDIKTPSGQMGETASLYRASAKNWQSTLDKYLPDVDENIKAHSTLVAIGSMAGQVGGSLLLAAATNGVGGLGAVATVFGSQQFYNIREEYLEKGYSLDSANIYAGLAALSEGGLEAIGFKNWLRYATMKPSLRNHLLAGLMEASQEMAQTTGEEFITNVLSKVREETLSEILANIAISGVAGFIPGAGISVVTGGMGIRQEKAAYELDNAVKNTAIVPQQQQTNVPAKEGQVIKGTTPKTELELAKANKGSNQVYEVVKNIANSYGVTDEKAIDGLYYFARNKAAMGMAGEELLNGLANQIVAYKGQLALPDKIADKENKEAAEDIKYHLSQEAADKFHSTNVKAMEESGIEKQKAEVAASQLDIIYKNLSEKLGIDLQQFKQVIVRALPQRKKVQEEIADYDGEVPFQTGKGGEEEIAALKQQIDQLDKLSRSKPKTTLLSTLRNTGADYSSARIDPQVAKDLRIKNVPVSKGGLGGDTLEYLIRHGFMQDFAQGETVSYEMTAERNDQANEMLERAIGGENVYRIDDMEKMAQAQQAETYKAQLQAELDEKVDQEGKRGYISLGDTINEIVLGRNSDISTLQHEMMHHFRNVINLMAAKGNKEAIALKEQMDSIIEAHKDEVKQKINSEEEVLSEAYEAWLYGGVVAENPAQQKLFDALKQFFNDVYDSVRAITGIRIDPEIDMFFRQLTGEMPIQMREEAASPSGKYDYKVTKGEKYGFTQPQREHIASEIINNMEGSLFSRFKVKDVKGENPMGSNWGKRRETWWIDENGKKTKEPTKAGEKYKSNPEEVIKINIPDSKSILTVHKDPLAIRAMFKDLGITITPKPEYANDMMYQSGLSDLTKQKAREVRAALQKIAEGSEEETVSNLRDDLEQYGGTNDVTFKFGDEKSGIRHIAEKHGIKTLLQVFDSVVDGKIVKFVKTKKTVHLLKNGVEAVLSLDENGNKKTWLLTGWDNKMSPEEERQFRTNLNSAQSTPTFSRRDLVAGLTNSIVNEGKNVKAQKGTIFQDGKRDLFATHNMNLAGTKQALKLGGLAMPSMAIQKESTDNPMRFGEISFVGHERLIAPKRGTEVYDRDAWTPSIWNNIRYSLSKAAKTRIETILKKTGEEKKWSMYVYNIEENLYDPTRNELALDLYIKEKGLPEESRSDLYDSPEYIKWYNENFVDDATPYLFTENDDNTDMINRKLTLNNIMKVLRKKERAAGGYIGDHIFSVGELVKFFPQRFRNLQELRSKKGNITSFEDMRKKIDALDDDFLELVSSLRTEGKEKEYGMDRYAVGLAIINTVDKTYQKDRLENAGLRSDDEAISKINKFAERLKNEVPVEYFEVKPRRVVDFGEFTGVIMPNTEEYDSVAKQLKSQYGLPVFRIESRNAQQYKEALEKLQKMYPTVYFQKDRQQTYRDARAQQTGSKAADPKPSKERIASDLLVIRNNGVEKYEPKSKLGRSLGDWGKHILLSVRQRAGAIDPKIKAFFDKLDYFQPNLEKKFASKANGFIKKFQGLTEVEKDEFDYYIYNQCHGELNAFLKEKGMEKEYNEVRQLLNFIYAVSNQAGIDMNFVNEYFPTSMIDYAGFLDYLKGTDKWSYIQKALREADPEGVWSDKEKAEAINKLLRGYRLDPISKPKNAKERTILYKSPELMKFYEHSDVALIKYLQGMSQAIAINKAFGKGGGFNTDETIGAIVLDLIESGNITTKEEAEIKRLLKSRLSYGATPEFIAMVKNVGYLQTMNNITSAITQLGDLYAPFYKYSFGTALKSIFGKAEITKTDLGLDKIWEEFSDSSKTGIAVDKLFKVIGLEKMDSFGKNVAINASLINLREQAAKGDIELTNRLAYTFGKDAGKVLADIKAGEVTEEVKILIWADLADTQPIGRSGVPTGYLDNPYGRLFYQLKTFSLNQISLFYADSLVNIQKGIKYGNKKQFLKGVQNGFKLLLLLTAGNAGADVLKNLIMGRDIDISDTVVSNLLWNIGVSKYTFYKGKRDGYARAILSSYLQPPQISIGDDIYMDVRKIATGKRELKDSQMVTYLPFGRAYYWWFGGGRTSEIEKAKKEKKAKRNKKKKK